MKTNIPDGKYHSIYGVYDRPHCIPLWYGRILIEHVELPASSDPRINLLVDLGRDAGNLGMEKEQMGSLHVSVLYLHVSDRNISEVG